MINKLYLACLFIVGLINFLPVIGLLGKTKLESTYGVKLVSNDLVLLMQHRALLFGLIGGFLLYSLWHAAYQTPAIVLAAISMLGFLVLMYFSDLTSQALNKVLYADYLGLFFLGIAVVLKYKFMQTH